MERSLPINAILKIHQSPETKQILPPNDRVNTTFNNSEEWDQAFDALYAYMKTFAQLDLKKQFV